jgi:UDP-2,3-diacylglucosamine pyrophosphatase LpxH
MSKGTTVYYLTGNHDELFRRYSDNRIGNLYLLDKLVLTIDDKKYWFFHGDIFDVTMGHSKWLAKLGSTGYNILILINRFTNWILTTFGFERISFSKRIKNSVKKAVQFISEFEKTITSIALEKGYDFVVCGHIHQPIIREAELPGKKLTYMNSGDWIENLTALEYAEDKWSLYTHPISQTSDSAEADEETEEKNLILPIYEDSVRNTMYG